MPKDHLMDGKIHFHIVMIIFARLINNLTRSCVRFLII